MNPKTANIKFENAGDAVVTRLLTRPSLNLLQIGTYTRMRPTNAVVRLNNMYSSTMLKSAHDVAIASMMNSPCCSYDGAHSIERLAHQVSPLESIGLCIHSFVPMPDSHQC